MAVHWVRGISVSDLGTGTVSPHRTASRSSNPQKANRPSRQPQCVRDRFPAREELHLRGLVRQAVTSAPQRRHLRLLGSRRGCIIRSRQLPGLLRAVRGVWTGRRPGAPARASPAHRGGAMGGSAGVASRPTGARNHRGPHQRAGRLAIYRSLRELPPLPPSEAFVVSPEQAPPWTEKAWRPTGLHGSACGLWPVWAPLPAPPGEPAS
jgi:hypothetical protein